MTKPIRDRAIDIVIAAIQARLTDGWTISPDGPITVNRSPGGYDCCRWEACWTMTAPSGAVITATVQMWSTMTDIARAKAVSMSCGKPWHVRCDCLSWSGG